MRQMATPATNLKRHPCNAIDCKETVPAMRFMYNKHWTKIEDDADRRAIMHGLRIIARGAEPTDLYLRAADNAVMGVGYLEMHVSTEEFSAHCMREWKRIDKSAHAFNERVPDAGKKREPPPKTLVINPRTGALLREARERCGFGLSTTAHGVAISVHVLSAIESGDAAAADQSSQPAVQIHQTRSERTDRAVPAFE
jgi:hypothetical protein